MLRLIDPHVVTRQPELRSDVLQTGAEGECLFFGDGRCELHAALGAEAKPRSCQRFPFGLTATPGGGRITTNHRCPCRTLGERPSVEADEVEPVLRDPAGRLRADTRVAAEVPWTARKRIPFDRWEATEHALRERLAGGEPAEDVLDAAPFPPLRHGDWRQVTAEMIDTEHEASAERGYATRFEVALGWFGETAQHELGVAAAGTRTTRAWEREFDRADGRSRGWQASEDAMIADWIADELWAMRWALLGPFSLARAELATRLKVVRGLSTRLRTAGARHERAVAEAVMIAEVTGTTSWWRELMHQMRA